MKNYISSAIFETNSEGKMRVQTWVYSALFVLCLLSGLFLLMATPCKPKDDNRREVRLSVQVPSAIQVVTRNGELEVVEVTQKPVENMCPCPCPCPKKSAQGPCANPQKPQQAQQAPKNAAGACVIKPPMSGPAQSPEGLHPMTVRPVCPGNANAGPR